MRIAIPIEEGQVHQHFGHTKQFKLYDISDDEIMSTEILEADGSGHSDMVSFLKENGVHVLLCGEIGVSAVLALREAGIQLLGGAQGDADQQITDFLNGKLHFESGATCCRGGEGQDSCEYECDGNINACGL